MSQKARGPLVPARPSEQDEAASYMPRIPWRIVIVVVVSFVVAIGSYWLREKRKIDELRTAILRVHGEELGEARGAYLALRGKLEGLIREGASKTPDNFVDPRLRFEGLRKGNGLYLRLAANDAKSGAGIERGALAMDPDAINSCLGLSPTSARGLYEKGQFLLPAFAEQTKKLDGLMELRVRDEVLSRHIKADLPSVMGLVRSDWFLLVIQHGDNRRDAPVDVFLWDLRHGDSLLRARVKSRGVLLGARILSQGGPRADLPADSKLTAGAANDCSIGSQIKALAGAKLAEVSSVPAAPPPAAVIAPRPDAGALPADGAATPAPAAPTP
jgi:hypothetical protein